MTTPRAPEPPGRASGRDRRGGASPAFSPVRAIVLLAVAIGLGAYLIDLGAGGHLAPSSASSTTTTTAPRTTPKSTTTTTTTTLPPGGQPTTAVKVLVANASETDGVATYYSDKLSSDGWGALTPVTATTTFSTSSVYYVSGDERAARAIAAVIGISSSAVQPIGPTTPAPSVTGADVVVVVGDDLASKVPASSS